MPMYKYQGELAKISMNTASGAVVLKKGVATELSADQVKAIKSHPVFAALLKSGELAATKETTTTDSEGGSEAATTT